MRGKDPFELERISSMRITPAHAGKRKSYKSYGGGGGSPPHMRGKALSLVLRSLCCGITPAHAGKRRYALLRCTVCTDHPRTCGEKSSERYEKMTKTGSPPHMRGKVVGIPIFRLFPRITPAHAGKSGEKM